MFDSLTKNAWRLALATTIALGSAGVALAGPAPGGQERAEISGVIAAQVSPVQAIHTAEAKAGGRAVDFGLEKNATTNAYEVTVATQTGLTLVQVDPARGNVIGVIAQSAKALAEDGIDATTLAQAGTAQVSLAAAVAAAEHAAEGRALEASYTLKQGRIAIDVDIAKNGAVRSVLVDGTNAGKLTMTQAEHQKDGHDNGGEGAQDND